MWTFLKEIHWTGTANTSSFSQILVNRAIGIVNGNAIYLKNNSCQVTQWQLWTGLSCLWSFHDIITPHFFHLWLFDYLLTKSAVKIFFHRHCQGSFNVLEHENGIGLADLKLYKGKNNRNVSCIVSCACPRSALSQPYTVSAVLLYQTVCFVLKTWHLIWPGCHLITVVCLTRSYRITPPHPRRRPGNCR